MSEIVNGEARRDVAVLRAEHAGTVRRVDNLEAAMKDACEKLQELSLRRARLDGVSTIVIAVITAACSAGAAVLVAVLK